MEKVHLISCKTYQEIKNRLLPVLEVYSHLFSKGMRVLVKPNLLSAHLSQEAVTTHPEVLRVVLTLLLELGCRPFVSDSPITQSVEEVARVSGLAQVCSDLDVPIQSFSGSDLHKGWKFSSIRLAREAFEADAVVNLAKLKTHSQMILTLAVKNTYGCMMGRDKQLWHVRAGSNARFADLLIDIHGLIHPVLNIVDGVVGMEGNGPANGTPKAFGVIGVAQNGFCLDHAIAARLGISEKTVPVLSQARRRGLIGEYEIEGDWKDTILLPATTPLFQATSMLGRVLPTHEPWPQINPERCARCGLCESHCPAGAIVVESHSVDKKKCIRCYVCHECCPHDAIQLM